MQNIAGTGQPAPLPMNLYPSELMGAPLDAPTNYITLNAGDAMAIPAGSNQYLLDLGLYLTLEYNDPISGVWRTTPDCAFRTGPFHMQTDGVSKRIANRLGCPMSAIVSGGGTGFSQLTATITANVGGSTWQPVVGGALSVSSVTAAGLNYTVPPIVLIPAPTPAGTNGSVGGVQATAYATLTNGSVSSVSLNNFGAGYAFAPTAVLVPSPFDTNFGSISQASITLVLDAGKSGAITAALPTNFGAPLATISALTLTAAGGAGSGATITPQVLQTILSGSIVAGGGGWGTATAFALLQSVGGGSTSVSSNPNPQMDFSGFVPRPATFITTTSATGGITGVSVVDGGMFLSTPTAALAPGGTLPTTLASITFATGSTRGTALLQPL